MKISLFILFFLPTFNFGIDIKEDTFGLPVYFTEIKSEADIIVYIDKNFYRPDSEVIWRPVKNFENLKIKPINFRSSAKLIIYITDFQSEAKWVKNHPLRGKLK